MGITGKCEGFGTFSPSRGNTVDSSMVLIVFGDIKLIPPINLPLLHLHAPEVHHFFMNNC